MPRGSAGGVVVRTHGRAVREKPPERSGSHRTQGERVRTPAQRAAETERLGRTVADLLQPSPKRVRRTSVAARRRAHGPTDRPSTAHRRSRSSLRWWTRSHGAPEDRKGHGTGVGTGTGRSLCHQRRLERSALAGRQLRHRFLPGRNQQIAEDGERQSCLRLRWARHEREAARGAGELHPLAP